MLRRPVETAQYLSIKYTERLAAAGLEPSVGSVGDSYDNALAETINGLYKTEVIRRMGPWRSLEAVEFATLEWVDWFNNRRLLEPDRKHPARRGRGALLHRAGDHRHGGVDSNNPVSGKPGAVHSVFSQADSLSAKGASLLGRSGTLKAGSTVPERRYLRIVFRDSPVRRAISRMES